MIKRMKNKLFVTICVAALSLGAVVPSTFSTVHASGTKTVYVDVEKNITGQAPILQPVAVTLDDTETILDATEEAVGSSNVDAVASYYGNYVAAFADTTDTFNNYPYHDTLDEATSGIVFDTVTAYNQPIITDANWLREKEYDGISGWMFTVNNTDTYNSGTYYTADTTLSNLPNGAVIRWEFSAASGCDLGLSGYLPDGTVSGGYYNWSYTPTASFFTIPRADKTVLISKMADHANKTDAAYTNALNALKTLEITQSAVNTAAAGL